MPASRPSRCTPALRQRTWPAALTCASWGALCVAAVALLLVPHRPTPALARPNRPSLTPTPTTLPNYDVRRPHQPSRPGPLDGHAHTARGRFLSKPIQAPGCDATGIVARYVSRHRATILFEPGEVDRSRRKRNFVTHHNGITHLTFQQQHRGIDVVGACLRASVTRHGEIISVSDAWQDRPGDGFTPPPFHLSARQALQLATEATGINSTAAPEPRGEPSGPEHRQHFGSTRNFPGEIALPRVYFPVSQVQLRPAWEVIMPVPGNGHVYEVLIDAVTGQLLRRWNRRRTATTEEVTYRVFSNDSPAPGSPGADAPTGLQFDFVTSELRTVYPAEIGMFSPSGWINDGQNETQGNNVDAHLDLNGDDLADLPRPAGVPYRVFDFPSSHPDQDPATYRDASVVQLFYLCNVFHDRLYELGFDETAHNFQLENFGCGGLGGDAVEADVQDGADVNSASFTTGAEDGTPARLQMHLYTGPTPDRDSAFERDLVYHELAHGVSVRLLEALPDGAQPEALTEGWSDFLALSLGAQPGDEPHGTYPFAPYICYLYQYWSGYEDNYYFGMRRFPYCTDLNKNPLTYADIDPAQESYPPEVAKNPHIGSPADDRHNAGEVWCMTLMECRANLVDRHGFDGNQLMLQLVIDGLMLSPSNPDFLEARDAVLAADLVNNAGENLDILWEGFAKRGLGASAVSPGIGVAGIVEAFDIPDMLVFAYPDSLPVVVPPDDGVTFAVQLRALGATSPIADTARLHYSIDGAPFVDELMVDTAQDAYEAVLPAAACGTRYDYYVSVEDSYLGMVTDPPSAPASSFQAVAALEAEVIVFDDLESESGWTAGVSDDDAIKGMWTRMDPEGTTSQGRDVQPEDDHTPTPGACCWVTDGRAGSSAGAWDVDGGKTTLTSPPVAIMGEQALISYWRWYSNDEGPTTDDQFEVLISNNAGGDWVTVETVGSDGPGYSEGWVYREFLISEFVSPTAQTLLRFVASDYGDPSLVEAAIDDVTVIVYYCSPAAPGDANRDGQIDLDDYAVFVQCLSGPDTAAPEDPPNCLSVFDFDQDQDVDFEDFTAFQPLCID